MTVPHSNVHVLLVEDNFAERVFATKVLASSQLHHFYVDHADRIDQALRKLQERSFDIVLLDLSLPDSQGLDTLSSIMSTHPTLPIVIMTGLADEKIAVDAVRTGAQDYLVKSQLNAETLPRSLVYAIERASSRREVWSASNFEIDLEKQKLTRKVEGGAEIVRLTRVEFKVFVLLFRNRGQTVSREQILKELWTPESGEISQRTVDKYISAIKKKCVNLDATIDSIYGTGYRLEVRI